jgi:hypothetical protein
LKGGLRICAKKENVMLRRTSGLLAVVLLCGVGQAGVPVRADEPVKTGEKRDTLLYVRTDPPGAKVLLNGKELGTSNGLFRVEPGTGSIQVELEGRKPGQRQVMIRANGITRVGLELKPQAEVKVEAKGAHFLGHLPQGTVELVGITEFRPTDQSRWWRPDGSAEPLGPYLPKETHRLHVSADQMGRTFLVRFENLPDDASWPAWRLDHAPFWEGDSVVDAHGNLVANSHMLSAALGASAQTADLRVGVSMGVWDTVITEKADSANTSSFSRDGQKWSVTFHNATAGARPDTTEVALTTTISYPRWSTRLVAVARDGSEHATSIGYRGGNGTAVFRDLPLSSIKEFRFQVRPYHWVEFKNVALQSGRKTNVEVVSPGDAVLEKEDAVDVGKGVTVETVPATVGVKFFQNGDSLTITEVKATSPDLRNGDKVIVKGRYTLASRPKASLCLFATATKGSGKSEVRPGQKIGITEGQAEFELSETLDCDGYLHVTFYSVPEGRPFGGLYFGTAKQMEKIKHWDVRSWYSAE